MTSLTARIQTLGDRRGVRPVAGAILVLGIILSLLSVNTFPVITNDGLVYIGHSKDLFAGGWVVHGFRQVGYPVFLAAVRGTADFLGAEPLLTTVVLQRLVLVCAGALAFRAWGWWSLPLLVYLFTPATVAYSNFLLIEALALPLAVLLVIPAVAFLRAVRAEPSSPRHVLAPLWGVLATLGALYLFTLRFTFAVYGAIPLLLAVASWKTPHRKLGVGLLVGFLLLGGGFAAALTLENRAELGVTTPSANVGHTEYYYAWHHVFRVEENQQEPDLSEYYDGGDVHDYEQELSRNQIPYAERDELFEAETSELLGSAGISELGSKLESMGWSLAGGRLHDVAGAVHGIIHSTNADIERWMYLNTFAIENGPEAFADEYNDGRLPAAIVTDRFGIPLPGPDSQSWAMLLVPLSIAVMVFGLRHEVTRWPSALGLLVVVSTAIGLGWIRADNFRFLVVSSAFGIAVGTSVLADLARSRSRRGALERVNVTPSP